MLELLSVDLSMIPLAAGVFGGFFGQAIRSPGKALGRLAKKSVAWDYLSKAGSIFSINPEGTPVSRGEVPAPVKPLPPAAQTPEVPDYASSRGAQRRRRTSKTILTGPRGLASSGTSTGKKLFGG